MNESVQMEYQINKQASDYQFMLKGKFSFDDHKSFRELLTQISEDGCSGCTLDLSSVTSSDSAGLGMLMMAFETAEKEGKSFKISRPNGQVRKLLEISDFEKVMQIEY